MGGEHAIIFRTSSSSISACQLAHKTILEETGSTMHRHISHGAVRQKMAQESYLTQIYRRCLAT
jgi:hypothetical protein